MKKEKEKEKECFNETKRNHGQKKKANFLEEEDRQKTIQHLTLKYIR